MNELDLFAAVIAIADPAERAALLERECAGRPDLRNRIEQLVGAHFKSNALLDVPATDQTASHASNGSETESLPIAAEVPGTVIAGRYKLLQQIGEGGMGSVWMADQTEPVKRRVAVKLIRVERGQSRTILSRFEAERQAIAVMDHPHIAKLLDAGTTAEGVAVLCDGAGQRDPAQRLLRRTQAEHSRPAPALHADLFGGAACPPEGDHPPRPEADQHPGRESRR